MKQDRTASKRGWRKAARNGSRTAFIRFDSRQCKACWKCIEVCPAGVFDKINLFFHKHAKIVAPEECRGCRRCVKACEFGALEFIAPAPAIGTIPI